MNEENKKIDILNKKLEELITEFGDFRYITNRKLNFKDRTGDTVETNFMRIGKFGTVTLFISDGTTPDGNLTGVVGDICLNGAGGLAYYCDTAGKNWTAM